MSRHDPHKPHDEPHELHLAPSSDPIGLLELIRLELVKLNGQDEHRSVQEDTIQGATDGAGSLLLPVYTVPADHNAFLTYAMVEAAGFTPAAPYSTAGWIGLLEWRRGAVVPAAAQALIAAGNDPGMLRSFGPTVAGAAWLPSFFGAADSSGWAYRPESVVCLVINGGPVSKQVTVSYRINLQRRRRGRD
jgi:hypothetical protein